MPKPCTIEELEALEAPAKAALPGKEVVTGRHAFQRDRHADRRAGNQNASGASISGVYAPSSKSHGKLLRSKSAASKFKLPVFPSKLAVERALHVPVHVQKQAQSQGCPAFTEGQSRVDGDKLLLFLFNDASDNIDWANKLKEYKAQREEIALQRDKGKLIVRDEVSTGIAKGMSVLFTEIERNFGVLPAALVGLDAPGIQAALTKAVEAFKEALRKDFSVDKPK